MIQVRSEESDKYKCEFFQGYARRMASSTSCNERTFRNLSTDPRIREREDTEEVRDIFQR